MTPLLLTEQEAAAALNMAPNWLATKRKAGLIPYIQLDKYVRYSEADLAEIIRIYRIPRKKGR